MINHFDVRNYLLLVVEFNNTEQIIFPKIADSLDDCSNFLTHVEIGKINLIKDLFTKYFESYVGDINFAEYCGCCAKDIHNINLETILLNLAGFYLKFG